VSNLCYRARFILREEGLLNLLRKAIGYAGFIIGHQIFYDRFVRQPILRLLGYHIINPYFDNWAEYPCAKMELALEEILLKIGASKFDTVIDHGCGDKRQYMPMLLRHYSSKVVGVDVMDKNRVVKGLDSYIQVPACYRDSYFDSVKSESVDAVFVFFMLGVPDNFSW